MIPVDDDVHAVLRVLRALMLVVGLGAVGLTLWFVVDQTRSAGRPTSRGSVPPAAGAGLAGGMLVAGAQVLRRFSKRSAVALAAVTSSGSSVAVPSAPVGPSSLRVP